MLRFAGLAIVFLLALAGCTSASKQADASASPMANPAGPPVDFGLDLTILTGPAVNQLDHASLRQSRYVLFPDGSLCYGPDPERTKGPDWLPPITRILTTEQIGDVWSRAGELGLLDPLRADEAVNFNLVPPPAANEVVYMAELSGFGQRWNFIRRAPVHQPTDAGLERLFEELSKLAWADQANPLDTPLMPKRYDFGPDPYSRYRKP